MYGSCKCGQIKFKASQIVRLVNCHCNFCRNMNGAAFSSYVVVHADGFCVEQGQELLGAYAATEFATKHFCTTCGTPIYNSNPTMYPGLAMIYLGSLSEHAAIVPAVNIYCSSKLGWVDSLTKLTSLPDGPKRSA